MLTVERLSEVRIGDVEKMAYELRDGVVCVALFPRNLILAFLGEIIV